MFLVDLIKFHIVAFIYGNPIYVASFVVFISAVLIIFTKKELVYRITKIILISYFVLFFAWLILLWTTLPAHW